MAYECARVCVAHLANGVNGILFHVIQPRAAFSLQLIILNCTLWYVPGGVVANGVFSSILNFHLIRNHLSFLHEDRDAGVWGGLELRLTSRD